MEQIIKQLYKLVNVVKVTELTSDQGVEREIMLLRVTADPSKRGEILDAAQIFDAKAVDVGSSSITFEVTGQPPKLNDFTELMRPYGVLDLVKSGRIALAKDSKTGEKRGKGAQLQAAG